MTNRTHIENDREQTKEPSGAKESNVSGGGEYKAIGSGGDCGPRQGSEGAELHLRRPSVCTGDDSPSF